MDLTVSSVVAKDRHERKRLLYNVCLRDGFIA
jgi:hypothetical protein